MQLRSGWQHLLHLSLIVLSGAVSPAISLSQTNSPAPLPSDVNHAGVAGQDSAVLLPAGRAVLAAALAAEERTKEGKVRTSISFPLPICTFAGGLCGAVNRDGTIAVAPEFDWVDAFHEGRALVRSHGLYGYVDSTGRMIAKPQYDVAEAFSRGLARIDLAGKSGLIDLEGREVLAPRFGFVVPLTADAFWVTDERVISDGPPGAERFHNINMLIGSVGESSRFIFPKGKWGLIDRSGARIRRPEFSAIRFFDRDAFGLMWAKTDAGWGLIGADGTGHVEPKFAQVWSLHDGFAAVMVDGRWGFVDETGRIAIEPKFEYVGGFSGAFSPARVGKRFGLIDRSGAWVVEPTFDMIISGGLLIPKSWWSVKVGDKYGVLDEAARPILSPQLDQTPRRCDDGSMVGVAGKKPRLFDGDGRPIEPTEGELWWPSCEGLLVVRVGDRFGYADRTLHPITSIKFEQAGGFVGGYAVAKFDGKFGLLKLDGTRAIEPSLEAGALLSNGVALAKVDGKFGMIDPSSGNWLAPPRFDGICSIQGGFILAVTNGGRGVMDQTGSWLIEPKFAHLGLLVADGLIPAQLGDRWAFIDAAGAVAIEAKYEAATFFVRGVNWVKDRNSWCPIDRRGQRIPTLQCEASDPFKRQFSMRECHIGP